MTAPNSRDSDYAGSNMAEKLARRIRDALGPHNDENVPVVTLVQRLSALPQQAGGEDVPEKVVAWMNEREAWRSPRAPSEPGTHALVLADDYAALQAEVARLRELLSGSRNVLNLLRSVVSAEGVRTFTHVESRSGSLVYVQSTIDTIDAAIGGTGDA